MSLYIGLMSGTSMDAIDTALVSIENDQPKLIEFLEYPISENLKKRLKFVNSKSFLKDIIQLDVELGELFAESVKTLLNKTNTPKDAVIAIGTHGQTIFHNPDGEFPATCQISDPNIIAARTGIKTVADFRRMDVAHGGQGAPLAPIYHAKQFSAEHLRVVLNVGGFANISILNPEDSSKIYGFDAGPGNVLLDDWIKLKLDKPFDDNGTWAASGKINQQLLEKCLAEPYFQADIPKSTGRDLFNLEWLENKLSTSIADIDVQATLMSLTVESIANAVERYASQTKDMIVCGGGAYNEYLIKSLKNRLQQIEIKTSDALGISPAAVEACCFAWLAHLRLQNLHGNLPAVTKANKACILGAIYQA